MAYSSDTRFVSSEIASIPRCEEVLYGHDLKGVK